MKEWFDVSNVTDGVSGGHLSKWISLNSFSNKWSTHIVDKY